MNIYVSSSWKNRDRVRALAIALRFAEAIKRWLRLDELATKGPRQTAQQLIDRAVARGEHSVDLTVQPGEVCVAPRGSAWQED